MRAAAGILGGWVSVALHALIFPYDYPMALCARAFLLREAHPFWARWVVLFDHIFGPGCLRVETDHCERSAQRWLK